MRDIGVSGDPAIGVSSSLERRRILTIGVIAKVWAGVNIGVGFGTGLGGGDLKQAPLLGGVAFSGVGRNIWQSDGSGDGDLTAWAGELSAEWSPVSKAGKEWKKTSFT